VDIVEIVRTVDGGIAIAVMLVIGWRMETVFNRQWHDLMELIDKLTNGAGDEKT
jgi:hypothetical protein